MNVQVKSSNGITFVPIDSYLMSKRKIFIEREINSETACEFVKKVMLLNSGDRQNDFGRKCSLQYRLQHNRA